MLEQVKNTPTFEVPPSSYHTELQNTADEGRFSKLLLNDFRLSFRYSGTEENQHIIFYLMGMQYFQAGVQEALESSLATISEEEWRRKASPPKVHSPMTTEHILREGKNEWSKIRTTLAKNNVAGVIEDMHTGFADHYGDLLSVLGGQMIRADLRHISNKGRPHRSSVAARYQSFFRDYILETRPTGSPTFSAIFKDMRQQLALRPPEDIGYLASVWRLHHGREFYPLSFVEVAKETGSQAFFGYHSAGHTELHYPTYDSSSPDGFQRFQYIQALGQGALQPISVSQPRAT